jgi:hypothetical protein
MLAAAPCINWRRVVMDRNSSSHVNENNGGIEALQMGYLQRVFTDRKGFEQEPFYGVSGALHVMNALYA